MQETDKHICIIGPISRRGGRELEAGFIANALSPGYTVSVVSTTQFYPDSQIRTFKGFSFTSLTEEIYKNSGFVRLVTKLHALFGGGKVRASHRLSSPFLKKVLGVEKRKSALIKQIVSNSDLVFICAQIYSPYIPLIVQQAKRLGKPVVFRTTGTIFQDERLQHMEWVRDVNTFVHHSLRSAERLSHLNSSYVRVDQCAYNEDALLQIIPLERSVKKFFIVSRLSWEKDIDTVIEVFNSLDIRDATLTIFGTGDEEEKLRKQAAGNERIIFKGHVPHDQLGEAFNAHDCLIISSSQEGGPLSGIEVMAAGRMVLSTRVGAMPERFPDLDIWYNGSPEELKAKIESYMAMEESDVKKITQDIRNQYIANYSRKAVTRKYLKCVDALM